MKIFTAVFTTLLLAVSLCGCKARTGFDAPEGAASQSPAAESGAATSASSTSGQESSPASDLAQVIDDRLIEEAVLGFGAVWGPDEDDAQREVIKPRVVSLYYLDSLTPETLAPRDCFSWYFSYTFTEGLTDEERAKKYANPKGENMGWFFPAEFYEPAVMSRFDVTSEFLRSDDTYYDAELGGYWVDGAGGVGERPEIIIGEWSVADDTVSIPLSINYHPPKDMMLTIRLGDGEYKYVSYLPAA